MAKLKDKIKFEDGFAQIRQDVAALQSPFGKRSKKEKVAMIECSSYDLQYFAENYFPHYLESAPSQMHRHLYSHYSELILDAQPKGAEGGKDAEAAPRGNAKSTITTLILPAWCIAFRLRQMIVILSDTEPQAKGLLEILRAELEVNERLAEDFPEIVGEGRKWAEGHIITRNNIRVRAYGSNQGLRGARHLNRRPDLVIGDDLENDQAVESPERRKKLANWFFKALMKAGAKYTVHIVVGTILHYDSLLAGLLKRPGWSSKKWQAVIKWSTSPLWEQWEELYSWPNREKEKEADAFFQENKKEMLEGTEVLWPEAEDYYYLMKMKVSDGRAYFDSEKQNEPINPEDCLFPEEDTTLLDEEEVQENIRQGKYQYFMAVDPSMGKASKSADPSAIVIGGLLPDGFIDIIEADIQKRQPKFITEAIFDWDKIYPLERLSVEVVQFQEFFKQTIEDESRRRLRYLVIHEARPSIDKPLRISKLQPQLANGNIRIRRKCRTLLDQLKYFPKADHDDGPDALEQLFSLIKLGCGGPRIRSLS